MKHVITITLFALLSKYVYSQDLKVIHFDVGNADATLFITSTGENLMVDSGNDRDADEIFSVLQSEGINTIDHYVTTHYHADHYGAIDKLVERHGLKVLNSYDRGDKQFLPSKKKNQASFKDYQRTVGNSAIHLTRGMVIQAGQLRATCLASGGAVIGDSSPVAGHDENDYSVALLIEFNGFRYFVGGDIHKPVEAKIAENDLALNVDVYQANHHGSHTSSDSNFLQDMKPSVVIISNGNRADYGHPRKVTIQALQALNPTPDIFQTNKFTRFDTQTGRKAQNVNDEFIADLDPSGSEGNITLELTDNSYDISFGSFSKTYSVKEIPSNSINVVIESLVPNPQGEDRQLEEVTIHNSSNSTVSLFGWSLLDASGRSWRLTGSISSGQSLSVIRAGQAMSLNNTGDIIELMSPTGVKDSFRYIGSKEGQRIHTGHVNTN